MFESPINEADIIDELNFQSNQQAIDYIRALKRVIEAQKETEGLAMKKVFQLSLENTRLQGENISLRQMCDNWEKNWREL
jgi:hypothetical protein